MADYEVEFTTIVRKLEDGRPATTLVARTTRWNGLPESGLIAIESCLHDMDGKLITMGATKALAKKDFKLPEEEQFLQSIAERGPRK